MLSRRYWAALAAIAIFGFGPAVLRAAEDEAELPLAGETERLEFSVAEGTWISLDVAADGAALVFELLGDLYELPIAGGPAVPITQGLGYDSQPRLSPDGQWIAFISDRSGSDNLWIARRDGTDARKLTSEDRIRIASPVWTPDGNYIVVSQRGDSGAEFHMYHRDGGGGLVLGDELSGTGAAFSPDGRYFYFAAPIQGFGRGGFPTAQIERFDMETGETLSITQGEGGGLRPAVSPDGRILAYATRFETQTGLRLRDLETGADRMLIWPIQRDSQENGSFSSRDYLPGYSFTPDSAAIIMAYGGQIRRIDVVTGAVSDIPFTADVALDVGPDLENPYRVDQGPVRARIIHDPEISPDGARLAASVLTKIYVMDAQAGASPRRLTRGEAWEFKPVWSPDGRWIAYVTWSMEDGGHIWRMRSNGAGRPQRLTAHSAFYTDLAFSPDGARLVALRGNEYQRHQLFSEFFGLNIPLEIVTLPANGGELTMVGPAQGARYPHFSNDPTRIYLTEEGELYSIRLDGSDRQSHLKFTGAFSAGADDPEEANRILISPDGRAALAMVTNQIYYAPVPKAGGGTVGASARGGDVPAARLTDIGADHFGWADGGATVMWAIGSTIRTRPVDSIRLREEDDEEETEDETGGAEEEDGAEEGAEDAADEKEEPEEPRDFDENVSSFEMNVVAPRALAEGVIVLRNANLIAMAGATTEEMARRRDHVDIVIEDARIAEILPAGTAARPGARVVDLDGAFVTPGFIDTHAHWEFRTSDVLEPQNWSLVANLAYGVTAGLDVQTSYKDYFAYRDLVETGQTWGERAFMTGPGVFSRNDFQSFDETLAYLRRYADHYETRNIKSYLVGDRKQRQWVVKAAKELGLMPTTEGGADLRLNITHAIDGMHGNEHTLTTAPLYDDVIELYARTRTAYTPTLLVQYNGVTAEEYFFTRMEVHDDAKLQRFYPHNRLDELTRRRGVWVRDDEFNFDETAAEAAKLQRAGGLVGIGGHGELQGLGYHWEMWAFNMGGMTPAEVLRAATIDGAHILGVAQDLGSIEPGKLADLVVLSGNPLEDIRNTNTSRYVMKGGALYDGETLDQLWPTARPLPRFWWWDAAE